MHLLEMLMEGQMMRKDDIKFLCTTFLCAVNFVDFICKACLTRAWYMPEAIPCDMPETMT